MVKQEDNDFFDSFLVINFEFPIPICDLSSNPEIHFTFGVGLPRAEHCIVISENVELELDGNVTNFGSGSIIGRVNILTST